MAEKTAELNCVVDELDGPGLVESDCCVALFGIEEWVIDTSGDDELD